IASKWHKVILLRDNARSHI
ncbi:hypothetical protein EAI_07075, partial [Harpegnathos saltator]